MTSLKKRLPTVPTKAMIHETYGKALFINKSYSLILTPPLNSLPSVCVNFIRISSLARRYASLVNRFRSAASDKGKIPLPKVSFVVI